MSEMPQLVILNVDDNAAGLYVKSRILRQAGFVVIEAATGNEALRLVAAEQPVLVLLDVKLPDISGLDVCRRIKTDPATATTLVLQISAALGEPQDRVRGLESGADGYLVDPITPAELIADVKALVRLWQREEENRHLLARLQQEITERKAVEEALRASEARLRAIIHAVPDVLLVLDEDGRCLEILTTQSERLYIDPAALKGQRLSDVLPVEVAQVALNAIRQTLLTRRMQSFEYDLSLTRADRRSFEVRTAPLDGLLLDKSAIVMLARDITQHRLTEESLRQAQKIEAVGQLTGGIAHDFNNLLAIVLGNLDLLTEALDRSELQDLVQRALEAAERGATLIQRLLAFARRQPLQAQPVELNRLVAGMIDLLRRTLGEIIQVETRLAGDLAQVVIDASQFETALLNLALNACDAMPNGGQLTIETANVWLDETYTAVHRPVQPGQYVLLTVSDTGMGMPPAVTEHAFEPFFTTKEVGKGSGLGLSMVYGLVKQLDGYIQLYSEVGRGTVVKIYLPPWKADTRPVPEAGLQEASPPAGQGQTILVVEDEAAVRRLAVHMLQRLDYQTVEADTATAALQALEVMPQIKLLFTDVVLPGGMSGIELAQEARRRRPALPVLLTSGYSNNHRAFSHSQEGLEWLSKPYRQSQLAIKLSAMLGSSPLSDQQTADECNVQSGC
jgi:PAS domain S-box-containing protein